MTAQNYGFAQGHSRSKISVQNPRMPLTQFNRYLSNSYYALTRTTNFDQDHLSHMLLVPIIHHPQDTHPCLPLTLHSIPFSEHTLLSYLCVVTSLLVPPLLSPGTHSFKTAQASFPSIHTLSRQLRHPWALPEHPEYDFMRPLILQYLSPWLRCEPLDNRDCISDLCIPSVSCGGHQMLAAQMHIPRELLKHAHCLVITILAPILPVLANSVSFLLAAQARNLSSHLNF